MTIDTKIEGNPDAVAGAAGWLRNTLASKIETTVDGIHSAKTLAGTDWHGDASDAFVTRMTSGGAKADGLQSAVVDSAQAVEHFADELRRVQSEMQSIRENAGNAGLSVDGFIINDPDTTDKIEAYATALNAADAARTAEKLAADTLKNVWADLSSKWFFVVGDLINGAAGTLVAAHSSTLLKHSKFLAEESEKFLNLAKAAPEGSAAALVYRDFDASRALAASADDAAKAAASAESNAGRLGLKLGGALAVGGVVYDIANGKDVDQAIVSGGVGFGASVLAGAAIGTAIPVPIVGTAVGAVGGAVVGIFASGAVDSLYQNGIGAVGDAISDGASAVADTGKALGGLAEDAWNQSSSSSELPREWRGSGRDGRVTVATAALVVIALVSLSFGAVVAVGGNPFGLLYAALFGAIMLLVAAFGVVTRNQRRDVASAVRTVTAAGAPATEISYSPRQFALLVALMTALAGTCLIGAGHLLLGLGLSVASALLAGFGLLGATFPLSALLGRIRHGGLTLSESGVSQRGWSFESSLAWADVAGVKAAFNGHPVILLIGYANAQWTPRYTTRLWRIDRIPPAPMIEVDCRKFDVDCSALHDYLACYVDGADLRAELGTTAAVERARRTGPHH